MKVDVALYEELMQVFFPVEAPFSLEEPSSDDEGNSKKMNKNNEGSKKKSSKHSTDVKMRKALPAIKLEQKQNIDSEMTNENTAESMMSTEEKAEKMETESNKSESIETDNSKQHLPLTRNKRPKAAVIQADLTPTEVASPPKFKPTSMETS